MDKMHEEYCTEAKRLKLPCKIHVKCPGCEAPKTIDFSDGTMLEYAVVNRPETIAWWCDECEDEVTHEQKFILRIGIELV